MLNIPKKIYLDGSADNYYCACKHCKANFLGKKDDKVCPDCEKSNG